MNMKEKLKAEIVGDLGLMEDMNITSDEYKTSAEIVSKLMDRAIELDRLDIEREKMAASQKIEVDLKQQQMKEERIDRIVKNILTGVSIVGGFGLTVWGTYKTLKFEETGTITTSAGRKFSGKLFSWLK